MPAQRRQGAAAALTLLVVNAWITSRLFHTAYTVQMGSIEAAFIGLARYIALHARGLYWFPLWYGGIPYPDSYPPLLHWMVAGVSMAAGISPGLAYHAVTATVYALGPVALFWTLRRFGAGVQRAFLGGLFYSLVSPTCFLVGAVRADSGGWFGPRRLVTLVPYGEGPHLLSLLFLTLAIGAVHLALERRKPLYYAAAAVALACTVLSNWIGAFALAVAVGCYLLAGPDGVPGKAWLAEWARAAAIGGFAYALAMPWATPSTIQTIRTNAPKLVGWKFTHEAALLAAGIGVGVLLLAWLLRHTGMERGARFAVMYLWSMAGVALGGFKLHIALMPQSERYHLEMDLAFWLAVTLAAGAAGNWIQRMSWTAPVRRWAWAALLILCVPVMYRQHRRALDLERPIDVTRTAEYRVSRWLDEHMPGSRVFAPGTMGYWMNAFGDTPMIVGGFDNGIRNQLLWAVNYQIYAGDELENTVAWLRVFGCDAIVGGDPASGEYYHPYKYPAKLHPLKELWRDGPEVIYGIPRGRTSLAHAIREGDLLREAPLSYQVKPLEPFLAVLDDPALPSAEFQWVGSSAATISADLRPEHLLYVQISWDKGWTARVNGQPRETWADALGQMVIRPACAGPCRVDLAFDGGLEMQLAQVLCTAATAAGLFLIVGDARRRRKRRTPRGGR